MTVLNSQFSGNEAGQDLVSGMDVVVRNSDLTSNTAAAAILNGTDSIRVEDSSLNKNTATTDDVLSGVDVFVKNSVLNDNKAEHVISATGDVVLLNSTLDNRKTVSSLVEAANATIVNSSMLGNPEDGNAVVSVTGDANVANSILTSDRNSVNGLAAGGEIDAAYSLFSGSVTVNGNNDHNMDGLTSGAVFNGRNAEGQLTLDANSPAAIGVWTSYNETTGEVSYTVRPEDGSGYSAWSEVEDVWTIGYKAWNMNWKSLESGNAVSYASVSSDLLIQPAQAPSIGSYQSGMFKPDFGPGINNTVIDPSYNGVDEEALTVVADRGSWFGSLYEQLFGKRFDEESFSVLNDRLDVGRMPNGEYDISLSVQSVSEEEFDEFVEEPVYEDGTPLSAEELEQLRKMTLRNGVPEESVALTEEAEENVVSLLENSDLFKDSFDKALDQLLGIKA